LGDAIAPIIRQIGSSGRETRRAILRGQNSIARNCGKDATVDESQNPYAPPKADTSLPPTQDGLEAKRAFSPSQGALGTFLGGPLAGTYYLRANYLALGQPKRAWQATVYGIIASLGILAVLPFLPEKTPNVVIPLAYAITVRLLIERGQLTKQKILESKEWTFHSNWRVAAVAAIGLIVFAMLAAAEIFLLLPDA
jgi:hypothetical protein